MGVWVNGPSPKSIDVPGIAAAMRTVLYQWMTGRVQIIDSQRSGIVSDYNPTADTGGKSSPIVLLDSGTSGALLQPIRSPGRMEQGQQANAILGLRIQLKREPVVLAGHRLRGGLQLKVLDGGEDPGLTQYQYVTLETIDSSLAWGRIFDVTMVTGQ